MVNKEIIELLTELLLETKKLRELVEGSLSVCETPIVPFNIGIPPYIPGKLYNE